MINSQQLDIHTIVGEYEKQLLLKENDLFNATINFINSITKLLGKGGLVERNVPAHVISFWYTRMASALSHYFANHANELDINKIKIFSRLKRIIVAIWAASGYRSGEHLKWLMSRGGTKKLSSMEVFLLINIISIDELEDQLIDYALNLNEALYFQFMLSAMSEKFVIMPQGQINRSKILASYEKLLNVDITDSDWMQIFSLWMFCSYAEGDPNAKFKKTINKVIKNKLNNQNIYDEVDFPKKTTSEKPTLVVLIEHFQEYHAMYRCYAPLIRGLKRDFKLIAVAANGEIDASSDDIFDQIVTFDQYTTNFRQTVELIKSFKPDIIYYPSVGMKGWTIIASNLRLAPIQIATQGHPDTIGSDSIDYVIIAEMPKDISHRYNEKIVVLNDKYRHQAHSEIPKIRPQKNRKDDFIHIAVNCKSMKLSNEFLSLCVRINQKSIKTLKFHFFPGESGITLDGIALQIQKRIPDAKIYGYMPYQSLLQHIRDCDLSLAPFPFGNTNSTVDACLMGIPVIALLGNTLASQTDCSVIKTAGLPVWLICESLEMYEKTVIDLIINEEMRKNANNVDFHEMRQRLYSGNEKNIDFSMADAFNFININHTNIIQKDVKVISLNSIDGVIS